MHATILIIAGSDPTGGAGVQADLKTLTTLGVYGAAAITAITVQNSRGVSRITPLSAALVTEQIQAVLEEHAVTHIKIGMLGNEDIAQAIGRTLDSFRGKVVWDPVLRSSTGQLLFHGAHGAVTDGLAPLLARTDMITPNLPELAILAGRNILNAADAVAAAEQLLSSWELEGVAITGGHGANPLMIHDRLLYRQEGTLHATVHKHPRLTNPHTHGTGCIFASALAGFHCRGHDWASAFVRSSDYVQHLIRLGSGIPIIKADSGGPLPLHLTGSNQTYHSPVPDSTDIPDHL